MRSGRAAGRADVADDVALMDVHAGRNVGGKTRHVGVQRLEVVAVADLDRAPVVEIPAGMVHDAVAGGEDRLAGLAFVVDAVVEGRTGAAAVVGPPSERRGDAGFGLGLAERGAAQPLAVLVEPALR